MRSTFPWGVSTPSYATDPTTTSEIRTEYSETRAADSNRTVNRSQIPCRGALQRPLGIALDGPVREGAVDSVERIALQSIHDAAHRCPRQGNVVGIAVHEADPAGVHADLRLIAGKQCASALAAGFPMQDLETVKMPRRQNQSQSFQHLEAFARPEPDAAIRPHDP